MVTKQSIWWRICAAIHVLVHGYPLIATSSTEEEDLDSLLAVYDTLLAKNPKWVRKLERLAENPKLRIEAEHQLKQVKALDDASIYGAGIELEWLIKTAKKLGIYERYKYHY